MKLAYTGNMKLPVLIASILAATSIDTIKLMKC